MLALMPRPTIYNREDPTWDSGKTREDLEDEMRFWPRVVWGDCGKQTGLSIIWFHPQRLLDVKKSSTRSILAWWSSYVDGPENDQAREILRLCRGLGSEHGLVVGLEKFVVEKVIKDETFLSSPRIASKVEFGLWSGIRDFDDVVRRRQALWQMPSEIKKGAEGDSRLKILGLHRRGPDHINDATKHCLAHMAKMRGSGLGTFEKLYGWNPDWETE